MSWDNFLSELFKPKESQIEITEIRTGFTSIYVDYIDNGVEDTFWFGVDELGMVEGKDLKEKATNVMKLYNFKIKENGN